MSARVCLSFVLCLAIAKSGLGAESRGPVPSHEVLCHCRFVKLSPQAAAEFLAAADLVTPRSPRNGPPENGPPENGSVDFRVCKNAEAALLSLKKAGRATISDWPPVAATSEKPASVLAGGEFPILIPAADGRVAVKWQRFGYRAEVTPRWLETGRLQLDITPEIAAKDFKHAVTSNGLTIPGLTTRRVCARVELNLGETALVNLGTNPDDESTITLFLVTSAAVNPRSS